MRQQHADTQRPNPYRFDARESQCAFDKNQQREGPEDEGDVQRRSIAPLQPLPHHQDGKKNNRALGEPLEEGLKSSWLYYDLFCLFSWKYDFHFVDQVLATYRIQPESKTVNRSEAERLA